MGAFGVEHGVEGETHPWRDDAEAGDVAVGGHGWGVGAELVSLQVTGAAEQQRAVHRRGSALHDASMPKLRETCAAHIGSVAKAHRSPVPGGGARARVPGHPPDVPGRVFLLGRSESAAATRERRSPVAASPG